MGKIMGKKIYIFGAHSRAQTLAVYLNYLDKDTCIEAYLYDNDEENPEKIGQTPVLRIDTYADNYINIDLSFNYPVYIATRGMYHQRLIEKLKRIGFKTIYPITQDLDLQLRNEYLEKYFSNIGQDFMKLDKLSSLEKSPSSTEVIATKSLCAERLSTNSLFTKHFSAVIYVVKSPFDRPLQQEYPLASYEREIYAGAAFVKNPIGSLQRELFSESAFVDKAAIDGILMNDILTDDIGENISVRNKQFCELTALYWIWKHAKEDVVGLAHYRRHFILPDDWVQRMEYHGVDVILPVPLYVAPNLEENYKKRHEESNWKDMMQCLKEWDLQGYLEACEFFRGNLYSPCNMFIMRREVLDELCTWLFPILFKVVEQGGQKQDKYQNRYPGFLSERLITFFFERNRGKYKTVYADKNFLP